MNDHVPKRDDDHWDIYMYDYGGFVSQGYPQSSIYRLGFSLTKTLQRASLGYPHGELQVMVIP